MPTTTPRPARLAAVALAFGLVAGACGGDAADQAAGGGGAGGDASGELAGSITIDGSSTVAPIAEAIAEEYRREQPDVQVSVGTSGTGGGFKKFCAGETDIATASRAIKGEEKSACEREDVEYVELLVGLDGLVVATSAENEFLECLSFEQLAAIYKEGGAKSWNEVDPSFPKEDIALFGPGTDSGTYDFFVEEVLGKPDDPASTKPRSDYTASEDDNVLVQGVEGEQDSLAYFGFAYFKENEAKLKAVEVGEEASDCVAPSDDTVLSGDYPLSRPLYIYVKSTSLERPEVKGFTSYLLETTPEIIGDVGYTAAPAEEYEKGLDLLEQGSGPGNAGDEPTTTTAG